MAYNQDEYEKLVRKGLESSPVGEVLIEESLLGWKEYELEMMRDKNDNVVVICTIENLDPMGVHTGDSITVAPSQTLTDREYQKLRDYSIAIMREIGVDSGGSNIQFSVNPADGQVNIIEMNPRVSRSSALASKATGYPIAKVAAKLAVGYTLDEIPNDITSVTKASFEPTIDYVVTKIPRFHFGKFQGADRTLTTQMKSVGEVMAIGRTFQESFQKAVRSLEIDQYGFWGSLERVSKTPVSDSDLTSRLRTALPERFMYMGEALRRGIGVDVVTEATQIDPWFVHQFLEIIEEEKRLQGKKVAEISAEEWKSIKQMGFSDQRLSQLLDTREDDVRVAREKLGVVPVYKGVDTCAAEFEAKTNYLYSTYEDEGDESLSDKEESIIILGSGPNRIGQGIEFDYCCVRASLALAGTGIKSIMVNCNPETVSTDYDTSDRLYFEPITKEDILAIVRREKPKGVILQFGGQTPLKLARALDDENVPILGTSVEAIDIAEDRDRFRQLISKLKVNEPENRVARSIEEAHEVAEGLDFPLMIRPSYVLGGRSMEIVHNTSELADYLDRAVKASPEHPVLIDRYLQDSIEIDVDALSDGKSTFVAGIMEHVEQAVCIRETARVCFLPSRFQPRRLKKSKKTHAKLPKH